MKFILQLRQEGDDGIAEEVSMGVYYGQMLCF